MSISELLSDELLNLINSSSESSCIEFWNKILPSEQNKIQVDELLLKSCEKGYLDFVRVLIGNVTSNGDFIIHNVKNDKGERLIHKAAESGSIDLCKYLVDELDVNCNLLTSHHTHAIDYAAQAGHKDLCLWFMRVKNIYLTENLSERKGIYLLVWAIRGNNKKLINIVINDIENIKACNLNDYKDILNDLFQYQHYSVFLEACHNGHGGIVDKLRGWAKELEKTQDMLEGGDYGGFRLACHNGHGGIVDKLCAWAKELGKEQEMLAADDYGGFRLACNDYKTEVLDKLWTLAKELGKEQEMLAADNYAGFRWACNDCKTEVLDKLWTLAKELGKEQEMLTVDDYVGFKFACNKGQTEVLDKLWGWAKELGKEQEMLAAVHYAGFKFACNNGQTEVLDKLWGWAKELGKEQEMLEVDDYAGFRWSCENGHFGVLDKLRGWAKELGKAEEMLAADDYAGFRLACENGHVGIVGKLWGWAKELEKEQEMLEVDDYAGFRLACENGHVGIVGKLWGWAKELGKEQEMLAAFDYEGFRLACHNGHGGIVDKLRGWAKELGKNQDMLEGGDYAGFRLACHNGHGGIVDKLCAWAKELGKEQDMLEGGDYAGFRLACHNGHGGIVEKLIKWSQVLKITDEMIAYDDYIVFREACIKGYADIVDKLLTFTHGKEQKMLAVKEYSGFRDVCNYGHVNLIRSLWSKFTKKQKDTVILCMEIDIRDDGELNRKHEGWQCFYSLLTPIQKLQFQSKNINIELINELIKMEQAQIIFRWVMDVIHDKILLENENINRLDEVIFKVYFDRISKMIVEAPIIENRVLLVHYFDACLKHFKKIGNQVHTKKSMIEYAIKTGDINIIKSVLSMSDVIQSIDSLSIIDHIKVLQDISIMEHLQLSNQEISSLTSEIFIQTYIEVLCDKLETFNVDEIQNIFKVFKTQSSILQVMEEMEPNEALNYLKANFYFQLLDETPLIDEDKKDFEVKIKERYRLFRLLSVYPLSEFVLKDDMGAVIIKVIDWAGQFSTAQSLEKTNHNEAWDYLKTMIPTEYLDIKSSDGAEVIKIKCKKYIMQNKSHNGSLHEIIDVAMQKQCNEKTKKRAGADVLEPEAKRLKSDEAHCDISFNDISAGCSDKGVLSAAEPSSKYSSNDHKSRLFDDPGSAACSDEGQTFRFGNNFRN